MVLTEGCPASGRSEIRSRTRSSSLAKRLEVVSLRTRYYRSPASASSPASGWTSTEHWAINERVGDQRPGNRFHGSAIELRHASVQRLPDVHLGVHISVEAIEE
jgi:hypothetical protein